MALLQDKVAIVTGGGTGIGKGIAEAFAREGAKVVLAARNAERLQEVADGIAADGGTALVQPTDVTDEAQVNALFDRTLAEFGRLDILVNNSGMGATIPTDEMSLETWQQVVDVNLTGAFLCCRQALRVMKSQGRGRILNIGSVSARVSRPHSAPYTATKFGLDGLTRSLALDARPHGIAVSILHPGNVHTAIWTGREEVAAREGTIPPEELARVAVTMVSLPDGINMLDGLILPVSMPFIGRG